MSRPKQQIAPAELCALAAEICGPLGLQNPPTDEDLIRIGEAVGVRSVADARIEEDGRAVWNESGVSISLRHDQQHLRKRFTHAHELGHVLISLPGQAQQRFRSSHRTRDDEERLCDALAAELLMPASHVEGIVHRGGASLDSLRQIRRTCDVSLSAAAVRLLQISRSSISVVAAVRDSSNYWLPPALVSHAQRPDLSWTPGAIAVLESATSKPETHSIELKVNRQTIERPCEIASDSRGAVLLFVGAPFQRTQPTANRSRR